MTLRASRLSVEKFSSLLYVARNCCCIALALKLAQICDDIFGIASHRGERRHPGSRQTKCDDLEKVVVGSLRCLRVQGNVGSPFAAAPVQTVAPRTPRFERSLAIRIGQIHLAGLICGSGRFLFLGHNSLRQDQGEENHEPDPRADAGAADISPKRHKWSTYRQSRYSQRWSDQGQLAPRNQ